MNKENESRLRTKKVSPRYRLEVKPDVPTLPADYVKCAIDHDTQTVTFIFFKKHYVPTLSGGGVEVGEVIDEVFLEVKVPFSTAFALALYMNEILKEIRTKKLSRGVSFGPVKVISEEE